MGRVSMALQFLVLWFAWFVLGCDDAIQEPSIPEGSGSRVVRDPLSIDAENAVFRDIAGSAGIDF